MKVVHLEARDLAERWNVHLDTLKKWRWNGRGPQFLKLNGKIVYPLDQIIEFEKARKCASTSAYSNRH